MIHGAYLLRGGRYYKMNKKYTVILYYFYRVYK